MNNFFNKCTSLTTVNLSNLNMSSSLMIMLDKMTFNQIEWCKNKGFIKNLSPTVANQLNMCAFYAMIPSDLVDEFNSIY